MVFRLHVSQLYGFVQINSSLITSKMFACIITILFSYSVAFMLVVVKIAAAAIVVPIAALQQHNDEYILPTADP